MLYLAALVALALVAFFAGSEAAFATVNRLRMDVRAQRAGWAGRLARQLLQEPAPARAALLVGATAATVACAMLLSLALGPVVEGLWRRVLGPEAAVGGWAALTETLVAAALVLVGGELLPRAVLREPPERVGLALAPPLRLAAWALFPLTRLAGWLARARPAGADGAPPLQRDFELVLSERGEAGPLDLDEEETEILGNVIELRALRVHDSMIPRTEIRAVEEGADLEAVRRAFVESGHSRMPVYRESLDRIVGVVLAHDLFHDPESLAAIVRPVVFVPESRPSRDLLFELLRNGTTFAVVLDEFGGTAGIVTVEDLLEELFGDIRDEHDPDVAMLRQLDDHTFLAAGRARLDELEEAFGLQLPEGDYDTVGGYLLDRVGTIPEARQSFDFDGLRFTVLEATASRIGTVRIETPEE
jgi:putative hemolysin